MGKKKGKGKAKEPQSGQGSKEATTPAAGAPPSQHPGSGEAGPSKGAQELKSPHQQPAASGAGDFYQPQAQEQRPQGGRQSQQQPPQQPSGPRSGGRGRQKQQPSQQVPPPGFSIPQQPAGPSPDGRYPQPVQQSPPSGPRQQPTGPSAGGVPLAQQTRGPTSAQELQSQGPNLQGAGRGRRKSGTPAAPGIGQGDFHQQQPQVVKLPPPQKQAEPAAKGHDPSRVARERKEIVQDFTQMQLKSPEKKQIIPGKLGRKIQLESNHLTLKIGGLLEAYHYDVAIKPDMPKKVLPTVFEMFRRQHFPDRHPAFDGRKNMYTPKKMPWPSKSGTIVVPVDEVNKTFEVEIKFANAVDLSPLHDLKSQTFSPMAALAVIDIVLRSAASKNCCAVGRSFFTKPAGQILDLGNGLEMYQGFYQSAIRGGKLLLNVDVAHKGFPKEQPVMDAIVEVCGSRYQQVDLTRELRRDQYVILEKYLRTLRVVYQIPGQPSTKRVYGVNGLSDPACRNSFKHNGVSMTIQNYFKTERRYILKYPNMPTLWVGSKQRKERIMVPAECCTILANQAVNRKMNENQTSAMIKYAATNTRVRKEKIMTGVKLANYDSDPVVKEFGFSVGSNFEQLEGRVLDSPRLAYNDNKEVQVAKGVWRADNMKFFIPVAIQKWTIAWADRYQPRGLENLERQIKTIGQKNGMHIGDAIKPFEFAGTSLNELTNYFEKKKDFNIIFVIVPNQGPIYSDVKKAAELKVGCLTQCIKAKTVDKLNPQTVANILLKVNSKLTGVNHCLGTVSRPPILSRPCMIMGADVTHPSPDAQNTPSVAAVVASHDPKAFRYNICWRLQNPKEEVIIDLKNIAKEQLLYFYNQNKCQKPHTIVFFRDGVSEGQFDTIRNVEIRAIQNACRELQADYEPKITFVVVQKRHHTRLFPKNDRDSDDRNINVPAGTCVDNTITNPCMQDFYLVSHASIQGVAKPTKYCTLWDDNNFSNDDLEQLAYFLCHMFTRCNRSVSYPAPTYYAHLAAARTKVYIENNKSLNMNNLGDEQTKHTIKTSIRKDKPMFFV